MLQELMVYCGQQDCYGNSGELLQKFLSIEVCEAQIYRVTDTYGEALDKEGIAARSMAIASSEDTVYVELDGSMVLTREDGWKEVKLSRIFKASDYAAGDEQQAGWIKDSQYLAHLGSSKTFTEQLYQQVREYASGGASLVFISDGAPWIKNWIEDRFEGAISILDYYHALEYLHEFAASHFKENQEKEQWIHQQKQLLLSSQVHQVIANIEGMDPNGPIARKVITYYSANQHRMDYQRYRQIGCGIFGSGAIESSHRTVIQKRMKLSGQRWSKSGAQHMLNLRVTHMNKQWNRIINLVKTEFKNAA